MQIICSNCTSRYFLSLQEIEKLKHSILTCKQCGKYIKITFCPQCGISYSITFSAVKSEKYSLKCQRCSKEFLVDFPRIGEARENVIREKTPLKKELPMTPKKEAKGEEAPKGVGIWKSIQQLFQREKKAPSPPKASRDKEPKKERAPSPVPQKEPPPMNEQPLLPREQHASQRLTLREVLSVGAAAFSLERIIVSCIGVALYFLLVFLAAGIEKAFMDQETERSNFYFMTVFHFLPAALFLFLFFLVSSLISRLNFQKLLFGDPKSRSSFSSFVMKNSGPLILVNILLLVFANVFLLLFGKIPLIGPVLYSLLFFPVYVITLFIMIFGIVGIWFYPPLIARYQPGVIASIRIFLDFVRRHSLNLIFIIPIMVILSMMLFSMIYSLHITAFSLTVKLSRNILDESVSRVFSAIPFSFQRVTDIGLIGADLKIFRSFLGELLFSHQVGGVILGSTLMMISVILYGSMVSFVATLSSHFYILLEQNIEIEDRNKVYMLLILVLMLTGFFLFKKVFF